MEQSIEDKKMNLSEQIKSTVEILNSKIKIAEKLGLSIEVIPTKGWSEYKENPYTVNIVQIVQY